MQEMEDGLSRSEARASSLRHAAARIKRAMGTIAQLYMDFKTSFYQALTQLASYNHRLKLAGKRMLTLQGSTA